MLGDSIFDNGAYTNGEPDVAACVRSLLPAWEVSLIAVDGSTTHELAPQLRLLPQGVTHLVISVGGNDALMNIDMLDLPVSSTAHALGIFARRQASFASSYTAAIDAAVQLQLPTAVCTIYNGFFEPTQAQRVHVALAMFNDVILRAAFARSLDVLDLGLICTEAEDYVDEIEPSTQGGFKIARLIAAHLEPGSRAAHPASRISGRLPT